MKIERRAARDVVITVRVEPSLHRKGKAAAQAAGVTLSDVVRSGLHEAARSILAGVAEPTDAPDAA